MDESSVPPHRSDSICSSRKAVFFLGIALFFTLIGSLSFPLSQYLEHQDQTMFSEKLSLQLKNIENHIVMDMKGYHQLMLGSVAYLQQLIQQENLNEQNWLSYSKTLRIRENFPGLVSLGYLQVIQNTTGRKSQPLLMWSSSVWHTEGKQFNSFSLLERREPLMIAMKYRQMAMSPVHFLYPEHPGKSDRGIVLYAPVMHEGKVQGLMYMGLLQSSLMPSLQARFHEELNIEVYLDSAFQSASLIYDSDAIPSEREAFHTQDHVLESELHLFGRTWLIFLSSTQSLLSERQRIADETLATSWLYYLFEWKYLTLLLGVVFGLLGGIVFYYGPKRQHQPGGHRGEIQDLPASNALSHTNLYSSMSPSLMGTERFFDVAPDPFFIINPQTMVIRANIKAHRLFEYENGEMVGITLQGSLPNLVEMINDLLTSTVTTHHFDVISATQKKTMKAITHLHNVVDVTVYLIPIMMEGVRHLFLVVQDVTDQKAAEKALSEAKERAESSCRSKSEFVANMSHEIRTPLNAVLGAAQLLEKMHLTATQNKYVNMIHSAGDALLGVINDILDFSKIEAGKMSLSPIVFPLDEILSRMALMMSVNVGEKPLELVIQVDSKVPDKIYADPIRLQQVLINFVSNAIKFTDAGHVILKVICEDLKEQSCTLRFEVADTGIGMTAQQQDSLFQAFSQADTSITRRFGGTGLGLVISSKIIDLMKGHIQVNSTEGRGTTFSATIKALYDYDPDKTCFIKALHTPIRSVLVVDDNPDTIQCFQRIFHGWEMDCYDIDDWKAFPKMLHKGVNIQTVDLVIIDASLGQLDAASILSLLKDMGLKDEVLTLTSVSSNYYATLLDHHVNNAFDAKIIKPITRQLLREAILEADSLRYQSIAVPLEPHAAHLTDFPDLNVLVVEDNLLNQTIAEDMLEDLGVSFKMVDNGAEAVEEIRSHPDRFDMVLMDIQMPVMDGETATQILRQKLYCTLPIIAMTANVLPSDQERYRDLGMDDLLAKPIDYNELFRIFSEFQKNKLQQQSA